MADSSITSVQNRNDGNMYYVIGGNGSDVSKHIIKVDTITERNALTNVNGFVLVRNAYKDDPTVNRGWAIYISDGTITTTTSRTWVKVIEEESVDGSWGGLSEVLESLASKAALSALENKNAADHAKYDRYGERIDTVESKQHTHDNKDVLDNLTDVYGQLQYRGLPVGGGAYVYEKINNSGLYWDDPTGNTPSEPVDSSQDIADKFCNTTLAYAGQTLQIVETDHSVSSFVLYKDAEGKFFAKFVGSVGGALSNTAQSMRFVVALPAPSSIYAGQGYFCLIPPGYCGNKVGHIFECVSDSGHYSWRDINDDNSSVDIAGPKLILCCRESWNVVKLAWVNPETDSSVTTDNGTTLNVKLDKTIIVRKHGQAPTSKEDGEVVAVISDSNVTSMTDVIPHSHLDVFYSVFAESSGGATYKNATDDNGIELHTSKAEFLDWKYIGKLIDEGNAGKIFSVGDIVMLPEHRQYGILECKVVAINETGIDLQSLSSIDSLPFDGAEYVYRPADGTPFKTGLTYILLSKNASGQVTFSEVLGYDLDKDVYVENEMIKENLGVFILPRNPDTNVYDPAGDMKIHGSTDWETSNLKQWLNAIGTNWFEPKPSKDADGNIIYTQEGAPLTFDRNGITKTYGFLNGFKDSDEASMNEFLRRVSNVRIPDDTDVVGAWVTGGMVSLEDGNKGGVYPENSHLVVPVITLSPVK